MPKATMDEYQLVARYQNDVRFAREIRAMQAVSVPHSVNDPTHQQLWLRVLGAHQLHPIAALLGRQVVHALRCYSSEL